MDVFSAAMAFVMLGTGLYLSIGSGFFQFSHLKGALVSPFERHKKDGGATPFQAMATALGSSVGTANIAGVAGAILLGGPGAVFWMWIAGFLGMATKCAEIVLALLYRDRSEKPYKGGPMYYIVGGLGARFSPLAAAFSLFGCLAGLVGTALVQSNTIAQSAIGIAGCFGAASPGHAALAAGLLTAFLTGAVIMGGAKRIGRFSELAVPFMALGYIAVSLMVITANRARLLGAFASIIRGAFGIGAFAGGTFGAGLMRTLKVGVARGVYSNEAGVGSSPMAHAGSSETDPVRQGSMGIFEVFIDTIVMCTMTALVLLTSADAQSIASAGSGMAAAFAAFASVLGDSVSSVFLSAAALLFAFTSLTGWELYGERCAEYLLGPKCRLPFRILFLLLIPVGAKISSPLAWSMGELFNYLMALPNVAALLLLSGKFFKEIRLFLSFGSQVNRRDARPSIF